MDIRCKKIEGSSHELKEGKAYTEPEGFDIAADPVIKYADKSTLEKALNATKKKMEKAAKDMDFMEAARLRDEMFALQKLVENQS